MLLLVEDLGIIQGYIGHLTEAAGRFVIPVAENSILIVVGVAYDCLEGFLAIGHNAVGGSADLGSSLRPTLPLKRYIRAGQLRFEKHYWTYCCLLSNLHRYVIHKSIGLLYTYFAHIASTF